MKRRHYGGITSIVVAAFLLGAAALVVGQSHVPTQVIEFFGDTHTRAYGARLATAGGRYVPKESQLAVQWVTLRARRRRQCVSISWRGR